MKYWSQDQAEQGYAEALALFGRGEGVTSRMDTGQPRGQNQSSEPTAGLRPAVAHL